MDIKFERIELGQTIIKSGTPENVLHELNSVYETKINNLPSSNYRLVGKIRKEHSIFYDYPKKSHNELSKTTIEWFKFQFRNYLLMTKAKTLNIRLSSIWINEMCEHEYNPLHTHNSNKSSIGLTSVMALKLPSSYGEEYSRKNIPHNGKLHFVGNDSGQFATRDYSPELKIGDFFVFPYDLRHQVYPMNQSKEVRRTLSANCDVFFERGDELL